AQRHFVDGVVGAFLQDKIGAAAGGEDVFPQIGQVDVVPDGARGADGGGFGQFGKAAEKALGIAEGGLAQFHEARHIPVLEHVFLGVDKNRKIDEIGGKDDRGAGAGQVAGLEDVEPLDDQYVG